MSSPRRGVPEPDMPTNDDGQDDRRVVDPGVHRSPRGRRVQSRRAAEVDPDEADAAETGSAELDHWPAARRAGIRGPVEPDETLAPPTPQPPPAPSRSAPSHSAPSRSAASRSAGSRTTPPRVAPAVSGTAVALAAEATGGQQVIGRGRARRAQTAADDSPASTGWRHVLQVISSARPRRSTVRGDIEGLRAIAVVAVLLYHLGVGPISGGFVGVDVFFVISGFLITSQLMASARRTGKLHLVDFYARRARRLLPAATVVLVATVLLGRLWLPRSEWELLAKDSAASAVYALNWFLAGRSVDYLAEDAQPTAVQQFWSLGVEEQFYLVWPLLIIGAMLVARRRGWRPMPVVGWTLFGLGVLSFVSAQVQLALDPAPAYFTSTARAWELALGAMVAVVLPRLPGLPKWLSWLLAPLGIAMVLGASVIITAQTPWPGWWALLPTLGTALVLVAGSIHDTNPVARLLAVKPLPLLGQLSYSMYLWHWPLIVLWDARDGARQWWESVIVVLLTLVLSFLTLRYIEDPIRFGGGRRRWTVLLAAVVAMACSLGASWALFRAAPQLTTTVDVLNPQGTISAPTTLVPTPTPAPSQPASTTPSASTTPTASATPEVPVKLVVGGYLGALALVHNSDAVGVPTVRSDPAGAMRVSLAMQPDPAVAAKDLPANYANGCHRVKDETTVVAANECIFGDPQGSVRVVTVGDSKMDQWQSALDAIGKRHSWRIQGLGKSGCSFASGPQYPACTTYQAAVLKQLLADPPDVVITSTYDQYSNAAPGMIAYLTQLQQAGSKIVLINDNPTPPGSESVYQCVTRTNSNAECSFPRVQGHGSATMLTTQVALKESAFIDMNPWICPPRLARCPVAIGNVFIYRQSSHLTNTYVVSMAPILERKLAEAGLFDRAALPLQPS